MTKYDEVMEKIKVTPEMRARILQNAAAQCKPSDQKKPARVTVLRRFAALAACLAVLLAGVCVDLFLSPVFLRGMLARMFG